MLYLWRAHRPPQFARGPIWEACCKALSEEREGGTEREREGEGEGGGGVADADGSKWERASSSSLPPLGFLPQTLKDDPRRVHTGHMFSSRVQVNIMTSYVLRGACYFPDSTHKFTKTPENENINVM